MTREPGSTHDEDWQQRWLSRLGTLLVNVSRLP
jgi:hypothetical protein